MNPVSQRLALLLAELSECLCDALAKDGAGRTCFCGVVPGASPSWDYCGECDGGLCGMGYIYVESVYPSSSFPVQDASSRCTVPFAARLGIGALRCAPIADESGALPDVDEMSEAFLGMNADMGAILSAIMCCSAIDEYALEQWRASGPQGGCVGGEWQVVVAL
jgi:hypothetical protein